MDGAQIGGNREYAIELPASPVSATITGCEFLGNMSEKPAAMAVSLYRIVGGQPSQAVATAQMWLTAQPGWHRADFTTTYTTVPNEALAIGLQALGGSYVYKLPSGETGSRFFRAPCAGWRLAGQGFPMGLRLLCGPGDIGAQPHLSSVGVPTAGASFQVRVDRALPGTAAVLLTGVSKSILWGIPLPFNIGLSPCMVLVSAESQIPVVLDSQGSAAISLSVPSSLDIVGLSIYQQWFVLDNANPLGLVLTAGAEARVGSL